MIQMYLQFLGHHALQELCPALWELRSARHNSHLARGWQLTFEQYCNEEQIEKMHK